MKIPFEYKDGTMISSVSFKDIIIDHLMIDTGLSQVLFQDGSTTSIYPRLAKSLMNKQKIVVNKENESSKTESIRLTSVKKIPFENDSINHSDIPIFKGVFTLSDRKKHHDFSSINGAIALCYDKDVLPKLEEELLNYKYLYQDDNLLFSLAFRIGCRRYNEFLIMRKTRKKPELMEEYLSVKNNFKGQVKDYLLYSIYCQMMDKHDSNLAKVDFETDCENEFLKNSIGDMFYLDKLAKSSASDILVKQDSSVIKFADIIKQHEGNVIYVDFWASWCEPCRKCLPTSKVLHEEYEGERYCVHLYLQG